MIHKTSTNQISEGQIGLSINEIGLPIEHNNDSVEIMDSIEHLRWRVSIRECVNISLCTGFTIINNTLALPTQVALDKSVKCPKRNVNVFGFG